MKKTPLQKQLHDQGASALARYKAKATGDVSALDFALYEIGQTFLSNLGGGAGYLLRKMAYRRLLARAGAGLIIGRGVLLRHPARIHLGDQVAVDDYVMIDASGDTEGVRIGDGSILSRNVVVQAKTGPVDIGPRADIGCNCVISASHSVRVGRHALIAANCYIGGARYRSERTDVAMMDQGVYSRGPLVLEDDVWIGASASVLDGAHIGRGSIIGAGSVVTGSIPPFSVAVGVPARVVKKRDASAG